MTTKQATPKIAERKRKKAYDTILAGKATVRTIAAFDAWANPQDTPLRLDRCMTAHLLLVDRSNPAELRQNVVTLYTHCWNRAKQLFSHATTPSLARSMGFPMLPGRTAYPCEGLKSIHDWCQGAQRPYVDSVKELGDFSFRLTDEEKEVNDWRSTLMTVDDTFDVVLGDMALVLAEPKRGAEASQPTTDTGFAVVGNQVQYNGKYINLPQPHIRILTKLIKADGKVVKNYTLDNGNGRSPKACDRLRTRISHIRTAFDSQGIPYTIKSEATVGYVLVRKDT